MIFEKTAGILKKQKLLKGTIKIPSLQWMICHAGAILYLIRGASKKETSTL